MFAVKTLFTRRGDGERRVENRSDPDGGHPTSPPERNPSPRDYLKV